MDRDPNLVSVIIPCYNHGEFILEAIQSILDQTYRDFEIIVVDDGSNDPATIQTLQSIRLPSTTVYHKENGHLSSARNFGIRKSKGAFILPLDSDDRFAPSFIEKALEVLGANPQVGVATCYIQRFGGERQREFRPSGGSVTNFLVQNNSCGNALFRYQCWVDAGEYSEELRGFEDWDFWIGVTKRGWLIHAIPEALFFYRDTPGSMLKTVEDRRPELTRKIVGHHVDIYREHLVDVLYEKEVEIRNLKHKARRVRQAYQRSLSYKGKRLARRAYRLACKLSIDRKSAALSCPRQPG